MASNVGVVQRGQDLRFALEACEAFGIVREGIGEDFQRDVASEPGVARPIDFSHSAFANLCEDFIDAETHAGAERQAPWIIPPGRPCGQDYFCPPLRVFA